MNANGDSKKVQQLSLSSQPYNVDKQLPSDIVSLLIDMENRDLSPEDYELLLRLDERLAPSTLNPCLLASLPRALAGQQLAGERCAVCMDTMQASDMAVTLPCSHAFHAPCIDQWLSTTSTKCPLDGVAVFVEE